jgi:hypothetical protein
VSPAFDGREGNPGLSDRERERYYATWRSLRKWKTGQHVRFWKGKGFGTHHFPEKLVRITSFSETQVGHLPSCFWQALGFLFFSPHFVLLNSFWEYRSSLVKTRAQDVAKCNVI